MVEPTPKPSRSSYSVGSMGFDAAFRGIALTGMSTRRPVALVASGRLNQSFGKGSRQSAGSIGSHCCGSAVVGTVG